MQVVLASKPSYCLLANNSMVGGREGVREGGREGVGGWVGE